MKPAQQTMQQLFLWSRTLCSPLEAIYTLLIFILSKELDANGLQLIILASTKPVVSLFAFYLSACIVGKTSRIRSYLIALNIAGCLPTLLFPYVDNVWYYVASYILFMTAQRAIFPAWNEVLKTHVGLDRMGSVISKGTSINYFITIFIPLILAFWMDVDRQIWKGLFFVLAVVQLINTLLLIRVPSQPCDVTSASISFNSFFILPWKYGWTLLREKTAFRKYLALFFLGGAGLVAIQPLLPIFFKENLHLSYQQLTLAFGCCKGIAFIVSSPLWARLVNTMSLYLFNCYVNLFSCLFFAFLLASSSNRDWLFLAYVMYGTMQAGCELSWNLSGPIFSQEKESTLYSGLNLVFVGLRGCLCPWIGQWIFLGSNISVVFSIAAVLCFLSCLYALWLNHYCKPLFSVR